MLNKIRAVMLGHAIADALGVPVEFNSRETLEKNPVVGMRGFGTHNVPAGCWSDDTSMSLCALESLTKGSIDHHDIMENFGKWYYHDKFTATEVMFDVGNTCADAIETYFNLKYPPERCGRNDERANGNGSLMRIHPFVLYAYYNGIKDEDEFVNMIADASSLTHAHMCSIDGCVIYSYVLRALLDKPEKESIYSGLKQAKRRIKSSNMYYDRLLNKDIATIDKESIKSSGYVVSTLEAAIWCLLTTESYSECVLKAVNLGGDTDTIAAVTGGLAGALYGIDSIPQCWLETLIKRDYIENMCNNAYKNWRTKIEI